MILKNGDRIDTDMWFSDEDRLFEIMKLDKNSVIIVYSDRELPRK